MFPKKFFWKTFFFFLLLIVLSSLLFSILLYRNLYATTLRNLEGALQKETEALAGLLSLDPQLLQDPHKLTASIHTDDRITIIALDGAVLADNWADRIGNASLENHADRPEFKAALADEPIFIQRFSDTMRRKMLYYAVPVLVQGKPVSVLRLSFSMSTFEEQLSKTRNLMITTALLAILLSLPLVYWLSSAVTRPIDGIISAANRIASGDLSHAVPAKGSQEFRNLADALNKMASQLDEKIQSILQDHLQVESLLSKMVEGVLALDERGKALFANSAFCQMAGLKMEKLQGRSYLEIVRNDQLSDYIARLLKENATTGENEAPLEAHEILLFGPSGEKTFSVQATRILGEGTSAALILVFHDITGIKKVEQIRRDFVANVSHELRTPLTALKGATEILLDGAYTNREECKKFLEIMDKQLQNIQNLVGDMLQLAAVDDTSKPSRREAVDLPSFIEEAIAVVQALAQKKHQTLKTILPKENISLNIDSSQISNALINLLENAIKYTEEGGRIELGVHQEPDALLIEVSDNGPGIPSDQLPRIFERFYRIDKSRSREMGGTGLGLAIAKHAVENHGGTITVNSQPGRGSTFIIRLPLGTVLHSV